MREKSREYLEDKKVELHTDKTNIIKFRKRRIKRQKDMEEYEKNIKDMEKEGDRRDNKVQISGL